MLQCVNISVVPEEICSALYAPVYHHSMFCAGGGQDQKDSCNVRDGGGEEREGGEWRREGGARENPTLGDRGMEKQSNRHELTLTQRYTSGRNRDRLRDETQREVGGGKQSIPEMQRGTETLGVRDREAIGGDKTNKQKRVRDRITTNPGESSSRWTSGDRIPCSRGTGRGLKGLRHCLLFPCLCLLLSWGSFLVSICLHVSVFWILSLFLSPKPG